MIYVETAPSLVLFILTTNGTYTILFGKDLLVFFYRDTILAT